MKRPSAGILMYRHVEGRVEVLLVHPGGPFWARRDAGAWSIPKGEYEEGEDPLDAARREFAEELGAPPSGHEPVPLGNVGQKGGKVVTGWAVEGDFDCDAVRSNTFTMEWPPRSGRMSEFPEVDRAEWFSVEVAWGRLNQAQGMFLDRLMGHLANAAG